MRKKNDLLETIKAHKAVCELLCSKFLSSKTIIHLADLKELLEVEIAAMQAQYAQRTKSNTVKPESANPDAKGLRLNSK